MGLPGRSRACPFVTWLSRVLQMRGERHPVPLYTQPLPPHTSGTLQCVPACGGVLCCGVVCSFTLCAMLRHAMLCCDVLCFCRLVGWLLKAGPLNPLPVLVPFQCMSGALCVRFLRQAAVCVLPNRF